MPSDPTVFDEIKLPLIYVPHGKPEPIEWLQTDPDYIKLPATFEPRARRSGQTDLSSHSPSPGQRRTVDGLAAPSGPIWADAGSKLTGGRGDDGFLTVASGRRSKTVAHNAGDRAMETRVNLGRSSAAT